MIEVRNLSKKYGSKLAVDGLTFTVSPGKVTGFLGPNGAGKTTTMRLLLGLAEPDGGIGRGGLLANCSTAEFIDRHAEGEVLVKTPDAAYLSDLIRADEGLVRPAGADTLIVSGVAAPRIAELAAWARIVIYELTPQRASLEEAFMEMTRDSVEFGDSTVTGTTASGDAAGGETGGETGRSAGRPFGDDRIGSPS
jgi:energy-coupling factor transporter ATP-binding protein EcfA2